MSLYKVGATWYVSIAHDGQRIRRSTGTDDRRQAQEYHDKLKADLWRSDKLGERQKVTRTWDEAAAVWMAAEPRSPSDAYRLRWISARWRGVALDSIDADAVAELIDERDSETANGLAPATVNRWLAQIIAILNVALRRGWIDKLPVIDHRPQPPGRTNWLTGEQWIRLRDALPQHLRQMARFAIATGLRRHNVTHLQWDQIDLARRVAWVHPDQTKAGNAIGVPLTDDAVAVLAEQRGAHDVLVFPWRGQAVFKTSGKAWHKATAAAGVPWCRWHDLRHTWASWHVSNGTRIEELMVLGGWKTLSIVQRYAHLSPEHLQRVAGNARPVERKKA